METSPKILIADDEPDFIAALQATLAAKAYRVVIANSRAQAQKMAWAERPDMIVLGTMMPRGDAFLLHQWLKRTTEFKGLPLIVLDAPPEKRLLQGWMVTEGLQLEADDYLAKPIEPASLMPRIEKLLLKPARMIRVLVVDDHAIIRDGIRALLALQRDMQVVGEAVNGKDALEKTVQLWPDVVLMDIVMPVMNGLEATKQICRECEQAKVLMLTQYDDEENVLASSRVGAFGFVPKRSASAQLLAAIRSVSEGQRLMPPVAH
jgi:DNA-binding NarL/FixJ family response regulator